MRWLRDLWQELVGLFVDDGALATQVVLLVAAVAGAIKLLEVPALWAAFALIPGCLAILAASVRRARRK